MRTGTADSYQERIGRVLAHIDQNLDDTLALDDLARVAYFSPFHFHRIFRGMVGEPVKEYVRRRRLERAAQRLRTTSETVLDIALEAGYETPESFARAFGDRFQAAPSAYRKQIAAVTIKRLEPLKVACVRHTGPFHDVGQAWGALMAWAGPQGLFRGTPRMVGIVIDDPEITPPPELRYDAAMVLTRDVTPSGPVTIQELPGGEYAVGLHVGPYSTLGVSYAAICGGWTPDSGRELAAAPALEFYLNSPQMTPPEELRTELWLPLEAL